MVVAEAKAEAATAVAAAIERGKAEQLTALEEVRATVREEAAAAADVVRSAAQQEAADEWSARLALERDAAAQALHHDGCDDVNDLVGVHAACRGLGRHIFLRGPRRKVLLGEGVNALVAYVGCDSTRISNASACSPKATTHESCRLGPCSRPRIICRIYSYCSWGTFRGPCGWTIDFDQCWGRSGSQMEAERCK